jgi:hypothetical protein
MNVTPPSDVIEKAYGNKIRALHARLEKFFSTYNCPTTEGGHGMHVRFYLEQGEWIEKPVQEEIERMYLEAGWLSLSFRYDDRIEFYFKPHRRELSND